MMPISKSQTIEALKYVGRYAFQIPTRFEAATGAPPIFLFATRRGGSTLLRDMIYSQPGINYIDQPFDLTELQFNPYRAKLPNPPASQFITPTDRQLDSIKTYLTRLISRKYILRSQWNWLNPHFTMRFNRYVVKILNAKALIDWFEEEFDCQIVYALRHPIPTAISTMKRNWIYTGSAYLEDRTFVEKYISTKTFDLCMDVLKSGNLLEKHVLEWCLENIVPLRLRSEKNWLVVHYENIILSPHDTAKALCDYLGLSNSDSMAAVVEKPTRTAWDSKNVIKQFGPEQRLNQWLRVIDGATARRCAKMLEYFQVADYRVDCALPHTAFAKDVHTSNDTHIVNQN